MNRAFLLPALAAIFILTAIPQASAAPVVPLITGAVTFFGSPVGQIILGAALQIGGSLLAQARDKDNQNQKKAPAGFQTQVRQGGDQPLSLLFGNYATAGQLIYHGSWGDAEGTPNAYLTHVTELANYPVTSQDDLLADGKICTYDGTPVFAGSPVLEFRKNGVDHLWRRFNDGTQTVADAFLIDKFGGLARRQWTSAMMGLGTPYVITTARINREVFPQGWPNLIYRGTGAKFYDLTKDSSQGGSGLHRRDDPATWEVTTNIFKIAYHAVFIGIYFQDEWLWGSPEEIPAARLPSSAWIAAMNECDRLIGIAGGGSEKQFEVGGELTFDTDMLTFLEELLKSASGRMSHGDGFYKPLCGAPGAAVLSLTKADIMASESNGLDPFRGHEATHNTITSKYHDERNAYEITPAPERTNAAYIAEDDGERLPQDVYYRYVTNPRQVGRTDLAMLKDHRRFRTHGLTLSPITKLLQANDVITYTDPDLGYSNKKFIIVTKKGKRNLLQPTVIQEVDPGDHDYVPANDEIPVVLENIDIILPGVQEVVGSQVFPDFIKDGSGSNRRPTIRVHYPGKLDDIQYVNIKVHLDASGDLVYEATVLYDRLNATGIVRLNGVFLSLTDYYVYVDFVPFSARETTPQGPLAVTTGEALLGADDLFDGVIDQKKLANDLDGWLKLTGRNLREVQGEIFRLSELAADNKITGYKDLQQLRRSLLSRLGTAQAGFEEAIFAATGPGSAFAVSIQALFAALGGDTAGVTIRWDVDAAPAGFTARYVLKVSTEVGGDFKVAGIAVDVSSDPGTPTRIMLFADQTVITKADGTILALFEGDKIVGARIPEIVTNMLAAGAVTADKMSVTTLAAIVANLGTIIAGRLRSADNKWDFNLNSNYLRYDGKDLIKIVGGQVTLNADLISLGRQKITDGSVPNVGDSSLGAPAANHQWNAFTGSGATDDFVIIGVSGTLLGANNGTFHLQWQQAGGGWVTVAAYDAGLGGLTFNHLFGVSRALAAAGGPCRMIKVGGDGNITSLTAFFFSAFTT